MSRLGVSMFLVLAACQEAEAPRESSPGPEFTTEVEVDGERRAMPVARLKLSSGVIASFFVWDDLSAGYLLQAESGAALPPYSELDGLSIADAFYALSTEDTVMPAALLQHHAALAADGTRPPWTDVVAASKRGWLLDRPTTSSLAACNNATFVQNNCTQLPGLSVACQTDHNGNFTIDAFGESDGGTRIFTAAFCIDGGGKTFDSLSYENRCDPAAAIIWLGYFGSPTYGTYTWIAPSGASPRRWRHVGVGSQGAVRDWATRWAPFQGC